MKIVTERISLLALSLAMSPFSQAINNNTNNSTEMR